MSFLTSKDLKKDNPKNEQDIQSTQKVFDGSREPALENKQGGARSITKDISEESNENLQNNRYVDRNKLSMVMTKLSPNIASSYIEYAANMKQICVYNPTTTIVKLGVNRVDTASYEFIVNANKIVVLPPFNFNGIYYLQESILAGFIVPIIFAYGSIELSPTVTVIT